MSLVSLVLGSTLKVSLVILAGLAASRLLHRRSAALRHWVLATSLVGAALLPLIEPWLPSWGLPARTLTSASAQSSAGAPLAAEDARLAVIEVAPVDAAARSAPATRSRQTPVVETIALAGTAASLAVLLVGLLRLTWLASRAQRITSGSWTAIAREIEREFGLRPTVELLLSGHPSLLVTWGARRPRVIIPRAALQWSDDRIRVVLRHELAHIQRGDWMVQLAGEVVRAAYWFNPLIWIACTRLRDESERACDDQVLRTVDGPEYATHLLELARALKAEAAPRVPAPAVARPSSLERRILAILDAHIVRTPTPRTTRFLIAGMMIALTIGIAGAQTGPTVLSGSVADPTGAPVPGVTVTLVNEHSRARFEVATDESGRYEFVPLPADNYQLLATYPAFSPVKDVVTLSGRHVQRDLTLALGEIQEQVSVRGNEVFRFENGEFVSPQGDRTRFKVLEIRPEENHRGDGFAMSARGQIVTERAVTGTILPAASGGACQPSVIGGRMRPPGKIEHVKPVYPSQVAGAEVHGEVELSGIIAADGTVKDLRVAKGLHPDLDASAMTAVSQWRFESPLLNCRPVDVPFTVKVDFGIQ
jgi:TonB family protein